jgi:23S rRNA pseudouridine1911/1915/1917 synthase
MVQPSKKPKSPARPAAKRAPKAKKKPKQSLGITILHESKAYLVINKPAGLVVHPDGKTTEASVVDWILEHYPKIKNVGEPLELTNGESVIRPGIVHRLDRDTSGALLIAKTQEAYVAAKSQFQNRTVRKIYNVIVHGHFPEHEGVIDRPIGRSINDFRKWTAERGVRGEVREAVTAYRVLEQGGELSATGSSDATRAPWSYVEARPLTGRTHQIRVHMKAINHPVVCDELYAPQRPALCGFNRLALHARSIEFTELSGEKVKVEAPLPADFEKFLVNLKAVC